MGERKMGVGVEKNRNRIRSKKTAWAQHCTASSHCQLCHRPTQKKKKKNTEKKFKTVPIQLFFFLYIRLTGTQTNQPKSCLLASVKNIWGGKTS